MSTCSIDGYESADELEAQLHAFFVHGIAPEPEAEPRTVAEDIVRICVTVALALMVIGFWRAAAPPLRFEVFGYTVEFPRPTEQHPRPDPRLAAPHLS